MTHNKRKKNSRQKGSHTYGWGSMKKHRGAGNRGGSGFSGTGKRADSIKPSIWADNKFFGRHGFHSLKPETRAINIGQIEESLDSLVNQKMVQLENGTYVVDLGKLKYEKLLGSKASKKFTIKAEYASKKAAEAVKKAGGSITLTGKQKKK